MKKEILSLLIFIISSSLSFALPNATYNYVWNGTDWIPWLATSEGKPYIYLDLINITGNRLVVNQTAYIIGKLGVGVPSPSEKLEVAGNILASGYVYGTTGLCIGNDCKTSWSQVNPWDNSTTQIFVREGYPTYVNVSNALFVNGTSGNVGIGTTSPTQKLEVNGSIRLAPSSEPSSAQDGTIFYNASENKFKCHINGNWVGCLPGGEGLFWTLSGLSLYPNETSWNVGIGTNAPSEKLEVQGRVLVASSYPFELQPSDLVLDVNGSINATGNLWILGNGDSYIMGKLGIGTQTPNLRLTIDNDGGILAMGTFGSGELLSVSGAGTRLIWYPRKAAFRVGYVTGNEWNEENIGAYSIAMGYGTMASGNYSTALGYNTTSSGNYSTALGYGTIASGNYSTAIGRAINVSGENSVGIGLDATVYNLTQPNTLAIMGGRVGIGTTSPSQKLTVAGNIGIQAGDNAFIGTLDNYALSLRTNNVDRIFITNTGNVGIGTTSPTAKLHVNGSLRVDNSTGSAILFVDETSGNVGIGTTDPKMKLHLKGVLDAKFIAENIGNEDTSFWFFANRTNSNLAVAGIRGYWGTFESANRIAEITFYTGSDVNNKRGGYIVFYTQPASGGDIIERMRITEDGNIGIGTTSPTTKLHVNGSLRVDNSTGSAILFVNDTSGNVGIGTTSPSQKLTVAGNIGIQAGDNAFIGTLDNYALSLRTNNVDRIFITNTGNVGIGTASPEVTLHVVGNGSMTASFMNGNVGIGTTTPSEKLEVQGRVLVASSSPFELQPSDLVLDVNGSINATGNLWILGSGNSYIMGKLGIGIASPTTKLHVNGSLRVDNSTGSTILFVNDTSGNVGIGTTAPSEKLDVVGNIKSQSPTYARLIFQSTGAGGRAWNWETYTDGKAVLADLTAAAPRIVVDTSGNVGIGTTDPGSYKLYVNGPFYATSKSSSANTSKGEVLFYSEEATEHWFKDYGKAKLVNGVAKIYLDPIYAEAISDKEDYMVFITLEDDCNGVYIAEKTKEYFVVKELRNGNSNASFVYQIVGKRKGYEGIRLEPLHKDEKN